MAKQKKQTTSSEYAFTVIYEKVRGGYEVLVPRLPGLVTFGRSFDEAREMAREAIECYLGALLSKHERIPSEESFVQERLRVAV